MTNPVDVGFAAGDVDIAGHLRIPEGERPVAGWPAAVLTGPLSGVKEQVVGLYAGALSDRGIATLCLDHRGFGASGGQPRQHEDPAGRLDDLSAAVSCLGINPAIDESRIGCIGVCLGGGYALRFAAFDPRIKAVACVAGGYNSPRAMQQSMGADAYRKFLDTFSVVMQREFETGEVEYLPAVAPDGGEAVMSGDEPFRYYGTERGAAPQWENRLSRMTVRNLVTLDLLSAADFISPTPLLVVHGRADAYCDPQLAHQVYERASAPKQVVWLDSTCHIDLYDDPAYTERVFEHLGTFFKNWL